MLNTFSRLLPWLLWSAVLSVAALYVQSHYPGNVMAVTLYKMHLMSLGGWGGYWLDRALFPYDRPHAYLGKPALVEEPPGQSLDVCDAELAELAELAYCTGIAHDSFGLAMIRRAIIVAASLLCVGLGA